VSESRRFVVLYIFMLHSGHYRALKLPTVVLACKSDLERQVEPQKALEILQLYDVGLVEVSNTQEGKEKMRRSFDWLLKAIFRDRSVYLVIRGEMPCS
jgi:hypothetical protein